MAIAKVFPDPDQPGRERKGTLSVPFSESRPCRKRGPSSSSGRPRRPSLVRLETADLQESRHGAMAELSRASLQQTILEERAALETPTDFADLECRGILTRAKCGWFALMQPKALPA